MSINKLTSISCKAVTAGLICILGSMLSGSAFAAPDGWITVNVIRSQITTNGELGGCAVKVTPSFESLALNGCHTEWVSFDCASRGELVSRDAARLAYDSAMLGFALNTRVQFLMTDDEVIDGICLAKRAVLLPN